MSADNPSQLRFNIDPNEHDKVSNNQLVIDFDQTANFEAEIPPRVYPSVNLAKRAIHLSRAIESDMKVAQLNGFLHLKEKSGASNYSLGVIEASIYPHRDDAQHEFDAAYGSVDELIEAGFDRDEVLSKKSKSIDNYINFIKPSNKKNRDKFRRHLAKKIEKDAI